MVLPRGLSTLDGLVAGNNDLTSIVHYTWSSTWISFFFNFNYLVAGHDFVSHFTFMSIYMCSYGVGRRMKLAYTRRIIDAIHDGSLLEAKYEATPIFNLAVPTEVKGVPSEVLHPENSVSSLMSTLDKLLERCHIYFDKSHK